MALQIDYNRDSLLPDFSIKTLEDRYMIEGEKSYVYIVSDENIANKTEIEIGLRGKGRVEILSGINEGDLIVAEGLKKVRPRGKIKPIKN